MKQKLKRLLLFLTNPRLLLCIAIAWMITNGWSYVFFFLGTTLNIPWMSAVGGAYLAFLWLPISPEKLLTMAIALFLLRHLFPHDQKTLGVLKDLYTRALATIKSKRQKQRIKKSRKARKDTAPPP